MYYQNYHRQISYNQFQHLTVLKHLRSFAQ